MQLQETLQIYHEWLDEHFQKLRLARDTHGGRKPIFALEHGLKSTDLAEMQASVRQLLRSAPPPPNNWLPIVVYAAEVGYRYSGDEFWQTFEAETPGWTIHGERRYVRDGFLRFAKLYGGARPTGRWADQFSIICWPITHAVLPTDLQQDLARLLYGYRYQLSEELVASPDELGARLASRAFGTSARFVNFAQSTDLLGQVAVALLRGGEASHPLLLPETLARIVGDLGKERLARRWLSEAQSSANRIRVIGFTRTDSRQWPGTLSSGIHRTGPLARPKMELRRGESGAWSVSLELPDFSVIPPSETAFHDAVARLRCQVAGRNGFLARGALRYSPRIALAEWPAPTSALIKFENACPEINSLLADECGLSPGPSWLFKLNGQDAAVEVVGKAVHPGGEYVVATSTVASSLECLEWMAPINLACIGIHGFGLTVPKEVGNSERACLRSIGIGVLGDIEVRPVGLVPAAWDGEGHAELIHGQHLVIAISTNRHAQDCVLTVNGDPPIRMTWPREEEDRRLYAQLSDLEVGEHVIRVAMVLNDPSMDPIDGVLNVTVREPRCRTGAGTFREALAILCNPADPSLEEVWDGIAKVQILGPTGLPIAVKVDLNRKAGTTLISTQLRGLHLPVDELAWEHAIDDQLRIDNVAKHYDQATACVIEVSSPDLGATTLRCEREFTALRWGIGKDRNGPYALLYDNVGAQELRLERLTFANPDIRQDVKIDRESRLRHDDGGLFVAKWQQFQAAVILPPLVRNLGELQKALVKPWVASGHRSSETVMGWMHLHRLWASARLPGDAIGRLARDAVLRSLVRSICSVVGGARWAACERAVALSTTEVSQVQAMNDAYAALADSHYQTIPATDIRRVARELARISSDDRIPIFARQIHKILPVIPHPIDLERLAGLLLQIASSPSHALMSTENLSRVAVDVALAYPMLLRAARFIVLSVHFQTTKTAGVSAYEGWAWD